MLFPGYLVGGRYRLVRQLGEGGMGVVWSAVNEAFGREVAIKVLLPTVATNPIAVDRFLTEARICGSLRHPGIVDVIDVGNLESGAHYLVMELLEGASVDKLIDRTGTLAPLQILPIVRDAARALALAHEKGIIHRDLKPANLFVHRMATGMSIVKVCDFGISKVNSSEITGNTGFKGKLTEVGTMVGSPAYMSPEQAAGREIDGRSDIWALGVLLYEALSGRLPYEEPNYNALIMKIAINPPTPLATIAPDLPRSVVEVVDAALAHKRDDRIPNGNVLAERIEAALVAIGATRGHPPPDPDAIASSASGGAPVPKSDQVETSSALSSNTHRRAAKSSRRGALAFAGLTACAVSAIAVFLLVRAHMPAGAPAAAASGDAATGVVHSANVAPPVAPSAPIESSARATIVAPAETVAPTASAVPVPSAVPSAQKPLRPQKPTPSNRPWTFE